MEHRIKVCLCCLVIVFLVIVCRFGHEVTNEPIIKILKLSERQPYLLTAQEIDRAVIFTIKRPFQFFGLL